MDNVHTIGVCTLPFCPRLVVLGRGHGLFHFSLMDHLSIIISMHWKAWSVWLKICIGIRRRQLDAPLYGILEGIKLRHKGISLSHITPVSSRHFQPIEIRFITSVIGSVLQRIHEKQRQLDHLLGDDDQFCLDWLTGRADQSVPEELLALWHKCPGTYRFDYNLCGLGLSL